MPHTCSVLIQKHACACSCGLSPESGLAPPRSSCLADVRLKLCAHPAQQLQGDRKPLPPVRRGRARRVGGRHQGGRHARIQRSHERCADPGAARPVECAAHMSPCGGLPWCLALASCLAAPCVSHRGREALGLSRSTHSRRAPLLRTPQVLSVVSLGRGLSPAVFASDGWILALLGSMSMVALSALAIALRPLAKPEPQFRCCPVEHPNNIPIASQGEGVARSRRRA